MTAMNDIVIICKVERHHLMASLLTEQSQRHIPICTTTVRQSPFKTSQKIWATRSVKAEASTVRADVSEQSDWQEVVVVTHGIPCGFLWSNSQPTRKLPLRATSCLASRRLSRVACPLNRALSGYALVHNHCFTINTHLAIWKR